MINDEELIKFLRTSTNSCFNTIAANRIEELIKELHTSRMASVIMDNTVAEAEAKLAKAGIVALETILDERGPVFDAMVDAAEDADLKHVSFNVVVGRAIRAALAELEKTE